MTRAGSQRHSKKKNTMEFLTGSLPLKAIVFIVFLKFLFPI